MSKVYREFTKKEEKWLAKFEKIMGTAPDSLFLFVGEGVHIYPLDENKKRYMNGDSVDSSAPCKDVQTKIRYDGGAY